MSPVDSDNDPWAEPVPGPSDMETTPPTKLFIGKAEHQWPVHAFVDESPALSWLAEGDATFQSYKRRVWKVDLTNHREYERVVREESLLPKTRVNDA